MVLPRRPGWEVLLLFWGSWGCWASPVPLIPCPEPCVCLDHTLINCSSSGLPHAPQHPSMDRTADLDLSHNLLSSVALRRPNPELLALRLGNNQISYLSLCLNEWSSDRVGRRMPSPGAWRSQRSQRCVSWAPGLLLLSMERNRLAESPRGLGGSRALQVLQLSYNQISTLEAGDLEGLHQLKELHLQHNLISSLHPRAFVGLTNLTVVDFSFNLLTSLSPATFWSLRLGLVVRAGGNPWRCDCEMANLKRRMALDEDEDQRLWLDMVCHSPSSLAGRDLLQLHEEDFGCGGAKNKPGLHQDLTVDHGSTVLLPCSMQKGSTWWTPKGQVSANESQAGLLMSDITERDAGLYICLSQSHKDIVSVYNLKIREQARANSRLPRSLPVDTQGIGRAGQVRAMTENQRLGLAVGLSIFFTFLVAFILGVFARPCIDVLCQKVCVKKNAPAQPGSVSSAGQSPYDNQAYSDEEDEPEIVSDRERRVTFSTQENQEESMNYKVTWASGQPKNQSSSSDEEQGNSTRTKMKSLKASSSQPVDSELGERGRLSSSSDEEQGNSTRTRKKSLKASSSQPVDSELGERGSLSSSSDEEEGNSTRTKKKSSIASPSQPVDNCINQKETDLEFTSEPFADWSPHLNDAKLRDQYQPNDSGDAFDFPESIQSGSARSSSLSGSFNHSKKFVFPTSNDLRQANRSRSSSSSASHLSEDESTQYTVNQETEEWAGMGMDQDVKNIDQTKIIKGVVSFDKQTHSKQPISITSQEVLEGELQNTQMATDHFDSSLSSSCESDDEVTEYTFNQGAADEDEGTGRNSKNIDAQNNVWPKLDFSHVTRIKQRLDITVETINTGPAVTSKDTGSVYRTHVKPRLDIKASTDFTSGSSESEEENTKIENAYQPHLCLGTVNPSKDFEIYAQENTWPELDLNNITGVKRHLDIKVVTETTGPAVPLNDTDQDYRYHANPLPVIKESTDFTSSSSESEDEPNMHLDTVSQINDFEINAQEDRWPELKLGNVNRVKRRLDIKATTDTTDPAVLLKDTDQDYRWSQLDLGNINQVKQPVNIKASTDSTSSSDSDEEPTDVRTRIENTSPLIEHLGTVSQKKESEMNVQNENWPVLDLIHVTRVKRRLDIKVATENTGPAVTLRDTDQDYRYNAKPHPDFTASTASTSSSSESEEEPNMHLDTVSQIKDFEINAREERWPELKLGNVNRVKRRLDIKATTDTTDPAVLLKDTYQDYRWSQLDLGNINQVKQPVNIKASTDSTSSSDSDEEPTGVRTKIENTSPLIAHLGTVSQKKGSEMNVQNENWPVLDLSHVTRVKRRLDIKVATENTGPAVTLRDTDQDYRYNAKPHPDFTASTASTSSSSESEEEPNMHLDTVSQIKDFEINAQEERWPELKLGNVNRVKRRLDIKATTETTDPAVLLKDTAQDYRWSQLDLGNINQVKQPVNIKASTDSTSSSDSDEEPTDVRTRIENTSPLIEHLGTVRQKKESEMNVQNENWPVLDLIHVTRVKRRLDIKVATENTGPAVTLRDTDQDYRYNVKPHPDYTASTASTSSSSDSEEEIMGPVVNLEDTYVKTKVENAYQPHLHVGTASSIKDLEIGARDDGWPELDLGNVNRVKRRLDIKATTETGNPAVTLRDTDQDYRFHVKPRPESTASTDSTSSSSESEEATPGLLVNLDDSYVKTKVETAYQPHLQLGTIKDSEINAQEERWPKLNLSNISGIKQRLDIKVKPHPEIKESTDFTSSSSESEEDFTVVNLDNAYVKTKVENAYQPKLHLDKVNPIKDIEINAQEDRWPELDLGNVNRVKRRLDIKATTETTDPAVLLKDTDQDYRWSQLDLGNINQVKQPVHIKASTDSTSRSDSDEEPTDVRMKIAKFSTPIVHLGTVDPNKESEMNVQKGNWPLVDLNRVKRRLDIRVGTETTGPTLILEDTDQDYRYHVKTRRETSTDYTSSSSSSDSEEESRGPAMNVDDKTKEENTHKPSLHLGTVKPIKDTEVDAKNDRWPELDLSRLPHIKRRLDFKASTKTPSSAVDDTNDDWWSHTDLDNITRSKRRLDIKVPTPLPERTSISSGLPLQSRSSSSSNDSDGEMKVQMVKEEREDPVVGTMSEIRWPDLNPRVPRIKRRIDVKTPLPIPHPGKVDPVQNDIGSSTSESEDEKQVQTRQHESEVHVLSPTTKNESIVHFKGPLYDDSLTSKRDPIIKLEKYAVITDGLDDNNKGLKSIPGPEYTPDLESRWAGLNLGKSRLRQRLDISANKAAPLKVSSETEIRSSSGERVDKIKEWAEKSSSVKDSDIDAQKETWPLVDLGNVTGVKRRLDIKVATPSPTSSSGDSGEANSWPVLDLDNISGIKRRLDIKTTPSSNISIEDWNTRLESPPPVPDSSTSNESENASMRHRRVDFPEYHTHGPARSFAQSVRGTSDTEVDSSFTTVDIKGWRSVKMGTQERRGLGALRAMSSERKRWDTDDKELGAEGSSQQSSHQGIPLREAPSLNYSFSGEDLEPHSSIISVQEARAPERLPRSRQRTEYQNRLMGRDRQGGDTKVDLRHPPEYLEIQNSTLFDSSNPMSEV
ncbi:uncharacterized protein lrrc66 [Gadus morhua]|uniref:uncharacterized protein lrrc66 n=1 Tax=Gadus morhua TaxID=8049 RepID=UPI0011B55668|nr:leucine-rich repeat-containing protein 66 [Gadus morhua]